MVVLRSYLSGGGTGGREEEFAELDGALGFGVPALGGVLGGVQVALDADFVAAFGEGEEAAHGDASLGVVAGEGGDVDEGGAPLALDVGAAAVGVVGVGVGVRAEPQVDRAGMGG